MVSETTEIGILDSRYVGDTMIGGQVCQQIAHDFYYDIQGGAQDQHRTGTPTITRFEGGVTYILSPFSGQFDTLLWLGAEPGDHWSVFSVGSGTHWFVNDVDTEEVAGIPLKKMSVSWVDMSTSGQIRTDTIYDRVGPAWSFVFYPFNVYVSFQYFDLRCYRDQDLSWSRNTESCEFPAGVQGLEAGRASIFPNPGSGLVQFTWPGHNMIAMEVMDALGRIVHREQVLHEPLATDLSALPAGMYNLLLTATDGKRTTAKWIRQ
jgi:hypothetical protein